MNPAGKPGSQVKVPPESKCSLFTWTWRLLFRVKKSRIERKNHVPLWSSRGKIEDSKGTYRSIAVAANVLRPTMPVFLTRAARARAATDDIVRRSA
jgi:hypothetical protein